MNLTFIRLIGLILPILAVTYALKTKPKPIRWIVIIPSIVFIFVGAVSQAGLAPIMGETIEVSGKQHELCEKFLPGSLITITSFILLVITCSSTKNEK